MIGVMSAVKPPAQNVPQSSPPPAPSVRKERAHAATRAEILAAARGLLVAGGIDDVTQRRIAAQIGMTAPALYRYFGSRELILQGLIVELYDELAAAIVAARDAGTTLEERFRNPCKAFREWSLSHKAEFALLFGAPVPGVLHQKKTELTEPLNGHSFGMAWLSLMTELWQVRPEAFPPPGTADPRLVPELTAFRDVMGTELSIEGLQLYLACWMRLYGAICIEVFGHLCFAVDNAEPLFDDMLNDMARQLRLAG